MSAFMRFACSCGDDIMNLVFPLRRKEAAVINDDFRNVNASDESSCRTKLHDDRISKRR